MRLAEGLLLRIMPCDGYKHHHQIRQQGVEAEVERMNMTAAEQTDLMARGLLRCLMIWDSIICLLGGIGLFSTSSSSEISLSSCFLRCRYSNDFHSLISSTFSSLLRNSSTFVGLVGSYSSSQSVSRCVCCCFFFFLRPPRWRFSPTPCIHSLSSVAAQSARVLFEGGAGTVVGNALVFGNGAALGMILGKVAFGLVCLIWGRRIGWKRSDASTGFFGAESFPGPSA